MNKKERLDKVISNMGFGSRKDIMKAVRDGRVMVNNKVVKNRAMKVDPYEDKIQFDNQIIEYRKYIYLMMNKPSGVVSSTYDPSNRTVLGLLEVEHLIFEPFPVGRLDKDTEGLLLLTNDGKLAHSLLSPNRKVPKTYYAELRGVVEEKHIDKFKEGVILDDGYKTMPSELEIIESDTVSKIKLTIYEGKYHQVKRMFQSIGMQVIYLRRISMGNLKLDYNLHLGEYRELTKEELEELIKEKGE